MTHLEMAGLLFTKQESKNSFPCIRRSLNLAINEEEETGVCQDACPVLRRSFHPDARPTDISHIYWGYAPLSIRLVELTLKQHRSSTFSRGLFPSFHPFSHSFYAFFS